MVMGAGLVNKEIHDNAENKSEQTLENDEKLADYFASIKIIDDAKAASTDIPAISVNDEKQDG